ncbi:RT0821/Lpp0805 family surface protein [Beggiatoa leptomitoformis]|uniref:Glycine zipper 2TM domain-containing protein n=1 Tax=Beggiatoa leptomitoformis TaxID=288004 RepID=A0A2N9YB78_9GAMM|nr:RT0821/Lpp0805 family surface protein [Beggiatoa leptomitoformis]ALG66914.1 glycine zipper 2TM domain-containing protein [Beggiatoa leptomitoformis]AUI67720.1 glycine zipper 2TM domain-containing protein [Beggiatoa leptomitoformis]
MKLNVISLFVVISIFTIGCAEGPSKQTMGAAVGGVLGGIGGSQIGGGKGKTTAIIAGTLLGAIIGGSIGQSMDTTDRQQAYNTLENVPDNQAVAWKNPNTTSQYTVTPTSTYTGSSGNPCRDYSTVAVINGQRETIYGTACRQPDGSWKSSS